MPAAALRIIRADLRARPLTTVLTGLVVAFAVGALVVTLHGRATLDDPYDRLFAETNGAHVTAVVGVASRPGARSPPSAGVVASEGPRPVAEVPVRFHGRDDSIGLIGLPRTRARIENPVILEGRRIRGPGEIVLWRGYAREHAAAPGDTIAVGEGAAARTLRVVGIGATTGSNDGGWADPADVVAARAGGQPQSFGVALRLAEPDAAGAFARRVEKDGVRTFDWRTERAALTDNSRRLITILQTTTLLALLAAAFTLATAISGRVLAQRRQIGLLRAIGLTPAGVTGVLVAYYLVLSALAAPLGLLAGAVIGDKLAGDFADDARRALRGCARRRPARALAADRAGRGGRGDRAARLAGGADAGAGRARARARGELGERVPRRAASRGGCICRS